jgi:sulfonate transport system permease protein
MAGAAVSSRATSRWRDRALFAAGPLLLLAGWIAVVQSGRYSQLIVVPPLEVLHALREIIGNGELTQHLGQSFHRMFSGFAAGAGLGLLFGALMAISVQADRACAPLFNAVRQVPSIAFIPLFIMIFGIGETFKVLIVAKAAFFPVALAAYDGVKAVSQAHLEVAKLYRLSILDRVRHVIGPAALANLLTGTRLGLGRAWGVLVAAELFAADYGIGQLMESGRQMFRLDIVFVGVLITGFVGYTLDRGLQILERRLTPWNSMEAA